MKTVLRYGVILGALILLSIGLYLIGQSSIVRSWLSPNRGFPAFEEQGSRRESLGDADGVFRGVPFEGEGRAFRDAERFREEGFERGGGFTFGIIRLGANLAQVMLIVALVAGLEGIIARIRRLFRQNGTPLKS